jgi:hypothetical protein
MKGQWCVSAEVLKSIRKWTSVPILTHQGKKHNILTLARSAARPACGFTDGVTRVNYRHQQFTGESGAKVSLALTFLNSLV